MAMVETSLCRRVSKGEVHTISYSRTHTLSSRPIQDNLAGLPRLH